MTGFEHPLARSALQEVVDLHAFFEAWLGGTAPDTGEAFGRIESALAETFSMVAPEGRRLRRAELLAGLRAAHGSKGAAGPFRIAVREPELLVLQPPLVVLGYLEEQTHGGSLTRRRSTAVLSATQEAGPVHWLTVHETWDGTPA